MITAGDVQYIKPTIIFRGSSGGKLPWPAERAAYDLLPNIRVAYQKNAWADSEFCQADIVNVADDIREAGVTGEICAGMDNHSAQRTDVMLKMYDMLGMHPLFTAADCTDCISPVDHHIGRFIQQHMGASYKAEISAHPEIWIATSAEEELEDANCSSAMHRRILMAQWLSRAWTDLTTNHKDLIRAAFVATGFLVALDGSEDSLIQLQGWSSSTPYTYR